MQEEQDEAGDEEENAVHYTKGKAGFQHRAGLVQIDGEGTGTREAVRAQADIEGLIALKLSAVGHGDAPELVDTCDEGANEA